MFDDPIFQYTRQQAIEDGVLIDVSEEAIEAGIEYATALTAAAWERCVVVPLAVAGWQDEEGRLWDVLMLLRSAIQNAVSTTEVRFSVDVQETPMTTRKVKLKAVCAPGDQAEPVVTVMLVGED